MSTYKDTEKHEEKTNKNFVNLRFFVVEKSVIKGCK